MITIPGGMTTRNWSAISAPAVSAAASNGQSEIRQRIAQRYSLDHPGRRDGMLHPHMA
jgi:hypothetical protein